MSTSHDVTTVASVDLQRYLGLWYEICRLPMKYEDATARDITAHYSLQDNGKIRVDNRCIDEDGKPTQSIGEAEALDASNAKLTVTFLPELLRWIPFTRGDYWILKLDPEYRLSLVGDPQREFLWLLAREPQVSAAEQEDYLGHARALGYDLSKLITPRQSGKTVSDAMLETAGARR